MRPFARLAVLVVALGALAAAALPPAVIRFSLAADPTNLNPLFAHADASGVEAEVARLAFEPFIDLDERGRAVPALLERIPTRANGDLSADGRMIIYRLRPGVRWSDGVPVTARDVVFTLHAILDERNPVASREGYELIDDSRVLDDRTVRIHLRRAWAPAVGTFFTYGTSPQYVLPAHVLAGRPLAQAAFNAAPTVGDGPFVFDAWQRGRELVYRANPRYWRGPPAAARIAMPIVPDPGANLTMLAAGDLDFNLVAPLQRAALAGRAGIAFRSVPTAVLAGLAFNTRRPPLDDSRVRRAIAASVDRAAISAKITLGAYPVAQSDRPRYSWAYDASIRQPGFDPRAADAAFDDAGWRRGADGLRRKDGRALALTYVQFPESTTGVRVAALVQEELRAHGVAVTIKSVSNAQLFLPASEGGLLATGGFDLAYIPWRMGADPDDRFILSCRGASENFMRFCDSAVERLEERAATTPDQSERRSLYRRIDAVVARDVPVLWLFEANYIYAYREDLRGFAPNAFVTTWNAFAWRRSSPSS